MNTHTHTHAHTPTAPPPPPPPHIYIYIYIIFTIYLIALLTTRQFWCTMEHVHCVPYPGGHLAIWFRAWLDKHPHKNMVQLLILGLTSMVGNIMRPRQDDRFLPDGIFKCFFVNGKVWIAIKISLILFPKGSINNKRTLTQIMTWCRTGDKPLSEPMVALFTDAYVRHSASVR